MCDEFYSFEEFCKKCDANCCKNWTIFVTILDIKRISQYTGLKPKDFSEFSPIAEWEKRKYSLKGKNHIYGFLKDEKILQIKKNKEKCFFLKGKACSIYPVRPTICKLYPFWFKFDKNEIKIITCIGYKNVCIIPEKILYVYKKLDIKALVPIAKNYEEEIQKYKRDVLTFVAKNYGKKN